MRRPTFFLLGVVGLLGMSACAASDSYVRTRGAEELTTVDTTPTTQDPFETSTVPEEPVTTEPQQPESTTPDAGGPVFTLPADKPAQPYDDYLEAAVNDIQNYWRNEFPALYGKPYPELQNGIHAMRPGDTVTPGCGEPVTDYSAVEGNAFYCGDGDFVAYDDAELIPQLVQGMDDVSVGVVLAHEWGHAIQARIPYEDETIYLEQQADCFAGSWLAHISRGESSEIEFKDSDLKNALSAMIFVRDEPGTTAAADPLAHGSAFDRVGAFEDGFRNGATQCATYSTTHPTIIQFGYDQTDPNIAGQENAPLDDPTGAGQDIVTLASTELNVYWPTVVPGFPSPTVNVYTGEPSTACDPAPAAIFQVAFYCPATNTVPIETSRVDQIYNQPELGDFGVVYVMATAWAEAALDKMGSTVEGEQRALAADCMVGAFTRSVLPADFNPSRSTTDTQLSPGDLDEAVSTAIAASDATEDTNENGSPFEKIESFRLGVLKDFGACKDRFGL